MSAAAVAPPLAQRAATARRLGEEAGQRCLDLTKEDMPDFAERAYEFIVDYVQKMESVPGESVTLAARAAGIRPHDDRAFGPIYAKAIRNGDIRVVGTCLRVRGHGTAGGRLYAPGSGEKVDA